MKGNLLISHKSDVRGTIINHQFLDIRAQRRIKSSTLIKTSVINLLLFSGI